ncbi:MAG: phenylalanine--tRNA ligase subunit beta, partial [Betaproteobacteria bacterium HGW-Betaproteobacteria-12]
MKFSESWLRTLVDPKLTSEELSHLLTMAGLEVEELDPVAPAFDSVVVGHVLEVVKHPDADRLNVCKVDTGSGTPSTIVCGAPNVAVGLKVPCALPGANLPGDFTIKIAKVRGIESSGMLCSAKELGLAEDASGLLILPADAPVGQSIRQYLDLDDNQFELKLTPNRADCLSLLGIAREVGAITGAATCLPVVPEVPATIADMRAVVLDAPEACPLYCGRVVKAVNAKAPTPEWMKRRLERSGIRAISALVDITNYVMLELGQPLHAFDNTKLEGVVHARLAKPEEKLLLLNEQTIAVDADILMISDDVKPLAMAGIMGGEDSGITLETSELFLESAFFAPKAIAGRARRYGFGSDASHRFERFVDAPGLEQASRRCAELILEVAGGTIEQEFIDERPRQGGDARAIIKMRTSRCDQILGLHVPTAEVARLLTSLGIEVAVERHGSEEIARCRVPANRHDLTREIDLIEEVGRLHGFEKIEIGSSLELPLDLRHPREWPLRERAMAEMGRVLTGMGFFETVTFSFVAEDEARAFCPTGLRLLKVDEERRKGAPWLRPSVIPSLLTCRRANQDGQVRREGGVRLFETASVFAEMDDGDKFARATIENQNLALMVDAPGKAEAAQAGIRLVRGAIEGVAQALGGAGARIELRPCEAFMAALEGETTASILVNGAHAGYLT